MNFIWEILHKLTLVLPPSHRRYIFDGYRSSVGISNTEGYTSSWQLLVCQRYAPHPPHCNVGHGTYNITPPHTTLRIVSNRSITKEE